MIIYLHVFSYLILYKFGILVTDFKEFVPNFDVLHFSVGRLVCVKKYNICLHSVVEWKYKIAENGKT